ncbi:MAG: hypothetical protein NTZ80_02745 [Patescibacteria group bacterium]|nr:hypothetical protein [Patescibacteria group bacterium]
MPGKIERNHKNVELTISSLKDFLRLIQSEPKKNKIQEAFYKFQATLLCLFVEALKKGQKKVTYSVKIKRAEALKLQKIKAENYIDDDDRSRIIDIKKAATGLLKEILTFLIENEFTLSVGFSCARTSTAKLDITCERYRW